MTRINIPDEHERGLKLIAEMNDGDFSFIHQTLEHLAPKYDFQQLTLHLANIKSTVKRSEWLLTMQILISLTSLRFNQKLSPERLASDLAESADKFEFGKDPKTREVLKSRIESLLSAGCALEVAAKSSDVLGDNQSQFVAARIMTDARPIFADNLEQKPNAFGILHQIKIVHYTNFEQQEFFITVDDSELSQLKDAIARAEKKSSALRAFLKRTEVPVIGEN